MLASAFRRVFIDHPATVNESYAQHLLFATRLGMTLLLAGAAAIAHGLLPSLFKSTASTRVLELAARLSTRFPDHSSTRSTPSTSSADAASSSTS